MILNYHHRLADTQPMPNWVGYHDHDFYHYHDDDDRDNDDDREGDDFDFGNYDKN